MRLGELDIPEEVLDARDKGELLVFAGAGVSMGGKSNYPSFRGLVEDIGENSGRKWEKTEGFDHYLGALENRGVDVHKNAYNILTDPSSKPNPLHRDILKLFSGPETVRIVTTNFDKHFTTVLKRKNDMDAVGVYEAPALPVGDDFSGLVYIHGSTATGVQSLVLTDQDFGKAYSTEGWARRFLVDAFRRYTVLFVGYSHNDPPMVYLTRGLTPYAKSLYAIAPEKQVEHWNHLGIEPVSYSLKPKPKEHAAVEKSVGAWAKYASMRMLDHKKRIGECLQKGVKKLKPQDDAYLQRCFSFRHLLPFFYGDGLHVDWLMWAEKAELLKPVFTAASPDNMDYPRHLAHWFAKHALANSDNALAVYVRAGSAMPEHLWFELGRALFSKDKVVAGTRTKWLAQLCLHWRPSYNTSFLAHGMGEAASAGEIEAAIVVLEFLLTPRIVHEKTYSSMLDPEKNNATLSDVKIAAGREAYWCKELWEKHLEARLDEFAVRLVEMAGNKIAYAYEIEAVHNVGDSEFSRPNFRRKAIEPNDQDKYDDGFGILVDIARDCSVHLSQHNRSYALALRKLWEAARSPLLRRLAVHNIRVDGAMSPTRKLNWLVNKNLMADRSAHHEVFMLAVDTFPSASVGSQNSFLKHLRNVTKQRISESPEYERSYWRDEMSLLARLHQATGGKCKAVKSRLSAIQKAMPELKSSEHPEYTSYSSGVQRADNSPLGIKKLREKSLTDAVRTIVNFRGEEWWELKPTRSGLMRTLQSAVAKDPMWGLRVAEKLSVRKRYPDDIWPAIVMGWHDAKLSSATWKRVITFLIPGKVSKLPLREIGFFLSIGIEKGDMPLEVLAKAERLAIFVMGQARKSTKDAVDEKRLFNWAINNTGGMICQFLLCSASVRIRKKGEKFSSRKMGRIRSEFETMIKRQSAADIAGCVILASRFHFLYQSDSDWTLKKLMPLLDWESDSVRGRQAWTGFLTDGKWSTKYLQKLLPYYRQSLERVTDEPSEHSARLADHVAGICLLSGSSCARKLLLQPFLSVATPDVRQRFARIIQGCLEDRPAVERHALWQGWLRDYWGDRNLGKPVPLLAEELDVMAEWCLHLGKDFPEAVELLWEKKDVGKRDTLPLRELGKNMTRKDFPEATAKYVLTYLTCPGPDYVWVDDELMDLLLTLAPSTAAHIYLNDVVELLATRGCIDQAEKLSDAMTR